VEAPLSNQPSGRVWVRGDDGKWANLPVEASKEELEKAGEAVKRASSTNNNQHQQQKQQAPPPQNVTKDKKSALEFLSQRLSTKFGHNKKSSDDKKTASVKEENDNNKKRPPSPPISNDFKPTNIKPANKKIVDKASSLEFLAQRLSNKFGNEEYTDLAKELATDNNEDDGNDQAQQEEDGDVVSQEDSVQYHIVQPGDTLNYICLKYKVTATVLRVANDFIGSSIHLAADPTRLIIPKATSTVSSDATPPMKTLSTSTTSKAAYVKKSTLSTTACTAMSESDRTERSFQTLSTKGVVEEGIPSTIPSTPSKKRVGTLSDLGRLPSLPKPPTAQVVNVPHRRPTPPEEEEESIKYHWVEKDDSLRWICLKYKVSANELRRANNFSGSNLKLAPKKLIIPKSTRTTKKTLRPRRLKSNGSSAANDYKGSSLRRSNESIDENNTTLDESLNTSFMTTDSQWDQHSIDIGADNVSVDVDALYEALGDHTGDQLSGNELNYIRSDSRSTNGSALRPMPMVHLEGASKLYGQMSCASDSDTDGSDSEEVNEQESIASTKYTVKGTKYHDVKPTDTIEYLCLRYRVSASALRRANIGLTGRNLQTGPKRLIIPSSDSSSKKQAASSVSDMDTMSITHDDDTNTIACSDGHSVLGDSTIASQLDSLYLVDAEEEATVYHDVQPYDTLAGICLQYGISAYELRRANNFRGMNLKSAPDRLVIPKTQKPTKDFKNMTEDEKIEALQAHMPKSRKAKKPMLTKDEARAYLEYNDWNFDQALRNAKVDNEWSSQKAKKHS